MAPLGLNVVLPHVRRNVLPPGFLDTPALGHVSVVTERGHAQRYGPGVDVHLVDSAQNVEEVWRATLAVLRERPVHRVLAPFELSVPVAGYLRSRLGLPGMDFDTANRFTDKYLMKRALAAAGVPVTPFRAAYSPAEVATKAAELGRPVVVKPVVGGGTLDVEVLHRGAEPPHRDGPLIVERFVDIEAEYNCNGIVHDGRVVFAAALRYPHPMLGCPAGLNASWTLPAGHPDRAGILDLHARAVRALGLRDGVTHLELFRSRDGLLAGEIACRPPGGGIPGGVGLQYDVDIWKAFRDTALGIAPALRPRERDGLVMNYLLPIRPGRIVRLSTAAELAEVPGVLRVDMHRRVGDVMRDRVGASAAAGVVHLLVRDEAEAEARMHELAGRYVLETEEEDERCSASTA